MGPSVGASVVPGAGKVANALGSRFPGLKALSQDSTELLKWLTTAPLSVAKALWNSPTLAKLAPGLVAAVPKLATGGSYGPASLPSPAIGLVAANNGRTLQQADFFRVLRHVLCCGYRHQRRRWNLRFGLRYAQSLEST